MSYEIPQVFLECCTTLEEITKESDEIPLQDAESVVTCQLDHVIKLLELILDELKGIK